MRSEEARIALRNIHSPAIDINACFDSKILLELKPEIFLKLCMIQYLLGPEAKPEKHYIDKMNKKLSNAQYSSNMKKYNSLHQWVNGIGCILKTGKLYFFEEKDIYAEFEFSLDGIERPGCCQIEGQEVEIRNSGDEYAKIQLSSMSIAARWHEELINAAKELLKIKSNIDFNVLQTSEDAEFELLEEDFKSIPNTIALVEQAKQTDNEELKVSFSFEAPSIELLLSSETPNNSK
jgi:hypothetical protein